MTVTAIEKKQSERYTVYVDDEYWYILDLEIILKNGLRVGLEVDEDTLDDWKCQAERRRTRERAYYLLGYRDHSRKELYDKLCKTARPEIAQEILDLVEEQGYLDDEKYAQKLARYYLETKKWGARKAQLEMGRRGIDRAAASAALADCEVDTGAQIRAVVEKKYYRWLETGEYKDRQRVIAALLRLGFSYGDIKTAIAAYAENAGNDDFEEAPE